MDPLEVKKQSEEVILALGGKVLDWLPTIYDDPRLRSHDEIVARALILHAMLNIPFGAPVPFVKSWITAQGVDAFLAPSEQAILAKTNEQLSEQETTNLLWSVEALWALMWLGGLIDDLSIPCAIRDDMVSMLPNLQIGEDGTKISQGMRLRSNEEAYEMLDLYYRAMWYARDGQLNGYPTPGFELGNIMERRKALEWALDPEGSDWDNVDSST